MSYENFFKVANTFLALSLPLQVQSSRKPLDYEVQATQNVKRHPK